MAAKYVVRLTEGERQELAAFVRKGQKSAYKIKHANILLSVDADGRGWSDKQTALAYQCHMNTVANVRKRFVELGIEAALERKKQRKRLHGPTCSGKPAAGRHCVFDSG